MTLRQFALCDAEIGKFSSNLVNSPTYTDHKFHSVLHQTERNGINFKCLFPQLDDD